MCEIRDMLNRNRGKFGYVVFEKKDKSLRKMNFRQGIKNGISPLKDSGTWSNSDAKPKDYNLVLVSDMGLEKAGKPSRRSFKVDSVKYLKIGGEVYGEKVDV